MNLITKINLMLFISIDTRNVQRLALSFTVSAAAAPAEIRTMVNVRSGCYCWFDTF